MQYSCLELEADFESSFIYPVNCSFIVAWHFAGQSSHSVCVFLDGKGVLLHGWVKGKKNFVLWMLTICFLQNVVPTRNVLLKLYYEVQKFLLRRLYFNVRHFCESPGHRLSDYSNFGISHQIAYAHSPICGNSRKDLK